MTSRAVGEKSQKVTRGSHRNDVSPLTQGLRYRAACDTHGNDPVISSPAAAVSSDISVSEINLVSVTVLCVKGSFLFLLYFSFENLFRFSCQFFNNSYFSFSFR